MATLGKHRQSLGVPRMKSGGSESTSQGGKPPTTLKLWIIRFQSNGVVLEGYKQVSDKDATTLLNWRSTPIAVRIDSKTLQTHSGSIYKLKGGIDEDEAAEAGISEELIEQFASGFPENWEELIQQHLQEAGEARRRQSINTTTTLDTERDEEEERRGKNNGLQFEETMDTGETTEDEERLKDAKKRRSLQKGRQSMMHKVQPGTPIEEEEEEEEKTPARKTPARRNKASETPITRNEIKKTPRGGKKGATRDDVEMEEEEMATAAPSTSRGGRTPREVKKTPKGRERIEDEEDEVFATPDEFPPPIRARNLSIVPVQRKEETSTPKYPSSGQGRVSLDAIPREIMEKSVPLTRWVIRFVRGGTDKSIFPHFQFKISGFRPECDENEWNTSVIQKVVPPYIMFTTSSIYRLDGQLDVDQSTAMGFPPIFIQDFLLGFPDDWEERLELFFNKTFGPPPQPKIVEVMSDGGNADEEKKEEEKRKKEEISATPRNRDGQKNRTNGLNFDYDDFETPENRKRKQPTPSSSSEEESESDEEEQLRREARKVEKEMRREEIRAQKEAELKAKAKEEKKKRFEVKVNTTPDGVAISRSGRTLRKPMAKWAGENITYDVHGNVVDIKGVTTTTKMTVGKTNEKQAEQLAAHYGLDSPLNSTIQKERAIAPPAASLPKTPAPKKSKADYRGYSDDETGGKKMTYQEYLKMKAMEDAATPAFILKKGKRRCRAVESSDSEAEAEERRKEEKRRKKEERRRLKESEEEESSDDGWRRKKKSSKSKKKVTVKKEKQVKRAPSKKRNTKKSESEEEEEEEEEGMGSEIEHDEDAVTFVLSDAGSNAGRGNGYSDNEEIQSESEQPKKAKSQKKKQPTKRAKVWKKEEVTRLKLAIQAANPSGTADGWENVAKSLGGERTAEECKKTAIEVLKMKFAEEESDGGGYGSDRGWSGAESGAASEDEERKNRRNARLDDGNRIQGINARPGTIAHAQEMETMKRERMMGAGQSQDDFLKNTKARMSGADALPSVAAFDPDDSLLEVLDDDDHRAAPKQRTTKTAMMAAAPATPRLAELSSYEDSPGSSAKRTSAKFIPSPVVNQNDLTRYVHQLSRTKNMSMLSRSAMDQSSRMMPPPVPRGRVAARAAATIDKEVNKVERLKNGRRRDQLDNLDEDAENEDILAGI